MGNFLGKNLTHIIIMFLYYQKTMHANNIIRKVETL